MRRIALGAALAVVIAACADDGGGTVSPETTGSTMAATTTTPVDDGVTEVEVVYVGGSAEVTVDGEPVSGRVQLALGTGVRLTVNADITSTVHVHGYEEGAQVSPGSPAVIEFIADIPGIFEVELHAANTRLMELQVS